MNHSVHDGPVACGVNAQDPSRIESIEHGPDDEALAQHELIGQWHQMVAYVAPDTGDQVQAAL